MDQQHLLDVLRPDFHAAVNGDACTDGGDGCCGGCGVSLVRCVLCWGTGYHRDACVEVAA